MKGLCAFLAFATLGLADGRGPAGPYDAAWNDASRLLPQDAHRAFTQQEPPARAARRESRLGESITLLNLQPRTDERVDEARGLLEGLAAEHADDEVDVFARFFLARLLELHLRSPEPAAARRLYRELLEAHPGHPLAERGAAQLVLIDVYAEIAPEERQQRVAALEQIGPQLTTPSGQREFYLNLGNACIDFGLEPARALACLLAADRAGLTHRSTQANTWIAIGELARAAGQASLARRYYGQFLARFPLDNRRTMIGLHLASLPAGASGPEQSEPPSPKEPR